MRNIVGLGEQISLQTDGGMHNGESDHPRKTVYVFAMLVISEQDALSHKVSDDKNLGTELVLSILCDRLKYCITSPLAHLK